MDTIFTSPPGGPAQPIQAIPSQQVPIQPPIIKPPALSPTQQPPPNKKSFRKVFNITSWIVLFALLPVTVLIFLSQNTVPGDLFYPIKRSLENIVLAAASVSPATRAAFRTDLTTRRFDEAEKLLLASSSNNGLQEFVTEIGAAQNEVSAISDPVKKQELQEKIQASITEYEKRLDEVKVKLVAQEEVSQLALAPTNTPVPVATPRTGQQVIPTNTPVFLPTSTPKPPTSSNPPIATPTPTPPPSPADGGGTIKTVGKVQEYLRCLQNTPAPHRECTPPEIKSESHKEENQLDRRNEEKSKREAKLEERKNLEEKGSEEKEEREGGNEDERKDKHEKEKKDSSDRQK